MTAAQGNQNFGDFLKILLAIIVLLATTYAMHQLKLI
jgi:hypothetical protein